jgi:hypothetical protein
MTLKFVNYCSKVLERNNLSSSNFLSMEVFHVIDPDWLKELCFETIWTEKSLDYWE